MKKMLVLTAIIAVLSIMFCGCGSATTVEEPVITEDEVTFEEEMDSEPVIEEPAVDVDWQTLTYQWEDASGYTFEATVRVSPWINTKNEAYVNAAWDEVGQGNSLPTFDPNERPNYGGGYAFLGVTNLTDMYYSIGEISIKNITPNWNIEANSPITSDIFLSPIQPTEKNAMPNLEGRTAGEVLTQQRSHDYIWSYLIPKFTSNNWGTVPFVFAHYERKTPNHPNGEYIDEISNTAFAVYNSFGEAKIVLDVIE